MQCQQIFHICLNKYFPEIPLPEKKETRVQVLHHKTLDWFFLPYEASSTLWTTNLLPLKQQRLLFHTPFNGDYVGYILPKARHGKAGPEQVLSLLGPEAASRHLALINGYLDTSSTAAHQSSGTSPE